MAKLFRIGAVVLVLGLAVSWAYRLGTPTLTEQQVETIALHQADYLGPGSVVTQAVLYPADQVRTSTGQQPLASLRTSGCITRVPLPSLICPMRSIWVVRVHTPGRNYDLFFDATTGRPA
jgi:hypothetical protein